MSGLHLPPFPKFVLQLCMVKSFHESGCSFHLRPSGGSHFQGKRFIFDYLITEGAISFQYSEIVPSKIGKGTIHLLNTDKNKWRFEHGSRVGYRQDECWKVVPDAVLRLRLFLYGFHATLGIHLTYMTNLTPLNYPTKTQFETLKASCNSGLDS
ncbi:hypothetical protein GE21DRAFT_1200357 [Neurospora crassa]|uniref:Uncharacterized protein 82C3.070 n=1 Tax=Neurospora crassa TaxID=5141 RepID=Q6MW41_NEUCS|nr:hypothetical protein GE21DRAFT_1200357 [Neurospora crassa]CAE76109.1 hypothetical protein [Neurospora crassa]